LSFGHAGACDHEDDATYMEGVRMVDIGDACHEGLERLAGLARRARLRLRRHHRDPRRALGAEADWPGYAREGGTPGPRACDAA